MPNYDSLDADWTWDGDYFTGEDGDLADNIDDFIRSLENEIRTVTRSEFNDWELHKTLGSGLSRFRGEPNTEQTGKRIKERVISSLVSSGIVTKSDLNVRVTPVSRTQVLIIIRINALASPGNRLSPGQPLVVTFTYDSLEDSVFFLAPSTLEREAK